MSLPILAVTRFPCVANSWYFFFPILYCMHIYYITSGSCFWFISQWLNSLRPSDRICGGNLTIIGSDSGLSPGRCQAIIWTNAGILLNWTLGTNFSQILSKICTWKCIWKCCLPNGGHFVSVSVCQCKSDLTPVQSSHVFFVWSYCSVPCASWWPGTVTLRPKINGGNFPDVFKCISLHENIWPSIKISQNFYSQGSS